jgi:hypothetical protein
MKTKMMLLMLVVIVLVSSVVSVPMGRGDIEVCVKDVEGNPFPNVSLTLVSGSSGEVVKTGIDGNHTFEFLPYGNYSVVVSYPDLTEDHDVVLDSSYELVTFNYYIPPTIGTG